MGPRLPPPALVVEVHRGDDTSVWLARHDDRHLAAVKVAHAGAGRRVRRRLYRQARRAGAIARGGAGVLAPLGMTEVDGRPASVWPWMSGRDLGSRLARHGSPDPAWSGVLADDLRAVRAGLARRGRAHGAFGAEHVLLDDAGRPHLVGLDPAARPDEATMAADRRAVEELCRSITGEGAHPTAGQPETTATGHSDRRAGRPPLAVLAGLVVTLVAAVLATVRSGEPDACPAAPEPTARMADVDGDGCDDRLRWSVGTGRLTAQTASGPQAWRLGAPGDRFLLGDWDCDGRPTPGLHRPSTGRTYTFDAWPTDAPVTAALVDGPLTCPHPSPTGEDRAG